MSLPVSIIIPAYNAGNTISHTMLSLLQQTAKEWEAIVVDDGSSDNTVDLVNGFIGSDKRIRLVSQTNLGASAARNHGLSLAAYGFVLFLDADDWIADDFLEVMTGKLKTENADAVVCCWARVDPSGNVLQEYSPGYITNLFVEFQQRCVFAIHSCIVRKSIVIESGGFDTSLRTCGDWDMWLRVVRSGAQFCELKAVKAFYRLQVQSLSMNGRQLLKDGITVITRGHGVDERIRSFSSPYITQSDKTSLDKALLHWTAWVAGLLLDSGTPLDFLFTDLPGGLNLELEPVRIANCLFYAATLPAGLPFSSWKERWPAKESLIRNYLGKISVLAGRNELADRVIFQLQQLIVDAIEVSGPLTVGSFYLLPLDVEEEIHDIIAPPNINTVVLKVALRNHKTATVELPVIDNGVSSWTIKDAVSLQCAWDILGEYFTETLYGKMDDAGRKDPQEYHNHHGWLKFLQELWDCPNATIDNFYGCVGESAVELVEINGPNAFVEVGAAIPDMLVSTKLLHVHVLAGGSPVGSLELEPVKGIVSAQQIRAAINVTSGFELCRICVRQAIIGLPFQNGVSLRERLHRTAGALSTSRQIAGFFDYLNLLGADEVPQSSSIVPRKINLAGLSCSRRVQLPAVAAKDLKKMSETCAEAWHSNNEQIVAPITIMPSVDMTEEVQEGSTSGHFINRERSRHAFENCYTSKPGVSPEKRNQYEQKRFDELIKVLGNRRVNSTLELSSGDVQLSRELARLSEEFHIAYANLEMQPGGESLQKKGITFSEFDQLSSIAPDKLDRIVCHESLYYSGNFEDVEAIARTLSGKLKPGGRLVLSHSNLTVDNPNAPGFNWPLSFGAQRISVAFNGIKELQLNREVRSSLYSIQVFEKRKPGFFGGIKRVAKYDEKPDSQLTALPPSYAATLAWATAPPSVVPEIWRSANLPVLRYQTPSNPNKDQLDSFEAHLAYLREAEYYSIYWFDWQKAVCRRQPLPGRPLAMTFDQFDLKGFEAIWQLIRKYGFTATVAIDMETLETVGVDNSEYRKGVQKFVEEGLILCGRISEMETVGESTAGAFVERLSRLRAELTTLAGCRINTLYYEGNVTNYLAAHLAGGCGYSVGLTDVPGIAGLNHDLMQLPAVPISPADTVKQLISKLE